MSTSDSNCMVFMVPGASHQQQIQGFVKVVLPTCPSCTLQVSAPQHRAQHRADQSHWAVLKVFLFSSALNWGQYSVPSGSLSPCCEREAIWFSFTRLFQRWRTAHQEYRWNHCPKQDWVLSTLWRNPRIHQVVKKLLFQRCNPFPADAGFTAGLETAGPPISHFLFLLFSLRN